jgi:hypothetical protein
MLAKKSVCIVLRYSPRVDEDLLLNLGRRPPIASLDVREEGLVHILRISGPVTARLNMPELHLFSRAFMPATPAVAQISPNGTRHAHRIQPVTSQISWRRRGELCLQTSAATTDVQGARVAGFGDYDVTDTKFSTRLGPPSCSPPV